MKRNLSSEEQHRRMIETPMPKLVTSMALPTVASQLVTVLYNTADTFFVSQIGTSAAAAVGVVFSLMSIIQAVGFGLGMGANSLVSRCLGAKKDGDACRYASSAFAAALVFGLLLMIGGLLVMEPLMRLLGSTDTILPYAEDYAGYILLGAPIMCASFVLNNILRSEGEAVLAMIGLCSGGFLNMGLDPLFIFTFGMGIGGAALATILSQAAQLLHPAGRLPAGKEHCAPELPRRKPPSQGLWKNLSGGIPHHLPSGTGQPGLGVAEYPGCRFFRRCRGRYDHLL